MLCLLRIWDLGQFFLHASKMNLIGFDSYLEEQVAFLFDCINLIFQIGTLANQYSCPKTLLRYVNICKPGLSNLLKNGSKFMLTKLQKVYNFTENYYHPPASYYANVWVILLFLSLDQQ